MRHLPERYERDQPEPGHAPERDHSEQEHERARLVSPDGLPCASRLGGEAAEERKRQQEQAAATARQGSASSRPPVRPNASTSGVVAVGPSA